MVLLLALCTLTCVAGALTVVFALSTAWMHTRDDRLPRGSTPISVLKPVKGVDDEFEANLESFCRQTHPCYELIVGAADPRDPALAVARKVKKRFPKVAMRIVSGEWPHGHNPKVRNLRNLLAEARYPGILVSDGDVRIDADYLSVLAGALARPGVGLVSNLVVGMGERSFGASCENMRLNGFVAGSVAASELLFGHSVVIGKSMLFRRDALTNVGGFASVANVLAEDYLLGRAVVDAGYDVVTLGHPIYVVNRDWTVQRSLGRHTRWSQIRRHVAPSFFALEPLAQPWVWWVLLVAACLSRDSTMDRALPVLAVASIALASSQIVQLVVSARLTKGSMHWWQLGLQPIVAALSVVSWASAWAKAVVVWRNHSFLIQRGSMLVPLEESRRAVVKVLSRAA